MQVEAGDRITMELSLVAEMEALVVAGKHQSRRLEIWGNPVLLILVVAEEAATDQALTLVEQAVAEL